MSQEVNDNWVKECLKDADGKWIRGTMECILTIMEKVAPYTWTQNKQNEEKYKSLIEIACQYIRETATVIESLDFGTRIEEDSRDLPSDLRIEIKQLVRKYLQETSS